MYEAPINIIRKSIDVELKEGTMKMLEEIGISINEEELLKALQYDRDQYQKGYEDGQRDAVVRGHWIKFNVSEWKNERECSACHCIVKVETCMGKPMYKYCPYCGCRMEEVEK